MKIKLSVFKELFWFVKLFKWIDIEVWTNEEISVLWMID